MGKCIVNIVRQMAINSRQKTKARWARAGGRVCCSVERAVRRGGIAEGPQLGGGLKAGYVWLRGGGVFSQIGNGE